MKKFKHDNVVFLLIIAVCLSALQGCAALYRNIEAPQVALVNIATPGISSDMKLQLTAQMRISNPNDIALPIETGNLRLTLNDVAIGSATIDDGFEIPANGSEIVALPATVDLSKALELGVSMLGDGASQVRYALEGHIDLGVRYLGRVPINKTGSVELGNAAR